MVTLAGSISRHAFYQVLGEDNFNGIAGRRVSINAQMAALELSVDKDWLRHKVSIFTRSGDSDPGNGEATGFDTIFDRPSLWRTFGFYVHQGFNLAGTSVNFKQRDSLACPTFGRARAKARRTSLIRGSLLVGYGLDADITPKGEGLHER